MSLLKSLGRAVGSIARVAAPLVGAINPGLGAAVGVVGGLGMRSGRAAAAGNGLTQIALPGVGASLAPIGPVVAAGARVAVAGAGRAMQAAVAWCRRNPAWCASVGGTAAVAAMVENGQLPAPRRSRGRGLTARDLRSFRRTVRVMRGVAHSVGLQGRSRARRGAALGGHTIVQN